jgi:Zn-dependent protease
LGAKVLSCPGCHALVHSESLKELAAGAERDEQSGNLGSALEKWRAALELLPHDSEQHARIIAHTSDLGRRAESGTAVKAAQDPKAHPLKRAWAGFVTAVLVLLSKAKLLLLGLTKPGTLSSMLVFMGIYWSLWGWQFAAGFVACIYVHEMGHVAALARYGIAASAPMFIPGFGAFVRLKQYPSDPRQDARVGLAGPVWGLGAALAAGGLWFVTQAPIWAAIARTAGFLNLFNLIPVWQLDGGRGFRSLSRLERWLAVGAIAATWAITGQGLLIILGIAAAFRAVTTPAPREPDWATLATYVGLIVALSWLATIHVSTGTVPGRY